MSNSGLWNYNGDVSMPVKKEGYFLAKLREVYCLVEHASRPLAFLSQMHDHEI